MPVIEEDPQSSELGDLCSFMLDFLADAGGQALAIQATAAQSFKADKTIVTEADLAISKLFSARLAARSDFNQHLVIDEENNRSVLSSQKQLQQARYVWTLDPIDGTMPYANQMPLWGILVSMFEFGVPKLGGIYLPALGELLYTDGQSAYLQKSGQPPVILQCPSSYLPASETPVCASTKVSRRVRSQVLETNYFLMLHTTAIYTAYALLGRVKAAFLHTGMSLWDVAPAMAIGRVLQMPLAWVRDGRPIHTLDFNMLSDDWKLADDLLLTHPSNIGHFSAYLPRTTAMLGS